MSKAQMSEHFRRPSARRGPSWSRCSHSCSCCKTTPAPGSTFPTSPSPRRSGRSWLCPSPNGVLIGLLLRHRRRRRARRIQKVIYQQALARRDTRGEPERHIITKRQTRVLVDGYDVEFRCHADHMLRTPKPTSRTARTDEDPLTHLTAWLHDGQVGPIGPQRSRRRPNRDHH